MMRCVVFLSFVAAFLLLLVCLCGCEGSFVVGADSKCFYNAKNDPRTNLYGPGYSEQKLPGQTTARGFAPMVVGGGEAK